MVLTKQAIKRLINSELNVSLWNGCFNKVVAKAIYSGNKFYELTVEVTHPSLVWQCGDKNKVSLVSWKGCSGKYLEVPDELLPLVDKMKRLGVMSDLEANELSTRNKQAFFETMHELGMLK